MGQVKIKTLEIGAAKLEGTSATVMDHPTIAQMAQILKEPIEGIVGFPFFARYKTTIDYQAKEITLVPSKYDPPDMMKKLTESLMASGPKKNFLAPGALIGVKVTKAATDEEAGVTIEEVFPAVPPQPPVCNRATACLLSMAAGPTRWWIPLKRLRCFVPKPKYGSSSAVTTRKKPRH